MEAGGDHLCIDRIPSTHFRQYIRTQGLSRLYTDDDADTSVFELLQDIPPEWNVTYAGTTA